MRIKTVRVENFRRLHSVKIDLDEKATVCVGANNSGKTSITHIFRSFFLHKGSDLTLYDFNSGCWDDFGRVDQELPFPVIRLDLLLEVERQDWYRVMQLMTLQDLGKDIGEVALRVEFGPREDQEVLLARYAEARERALKSTRSGTAEKGPYSPWLENMWDYLDKILKESYALSYHVLDPESFQNDDSGVVVGPLENSPTAAQNFLKRLVRVDMVDAQRFLSDDSTSNGRDLSRHLRRFYQRNVDTDEIDHDALRALRESERSYEKYLDSMFKDTFDSVRNMSYPGLKKCPNWSCEAASTTKVFLPTVLRCTTNSPRMERMESHGYYPSATTGWGTRTCSTCSSKSSTCTSSGPRKMLSVRHCTW